VTSTANVGAVTPCAAKTTDLGVEMRAHALEARHDPDRRDVEVGPRLGPRRQEGVDGVVRHAVGVVHVWQ
jgi:hypothetical protein